MNTFRSVQQKRWLHLLTTGVRAAAFLLVVFASVLALAPQGGHPGPVEAAPLSSYAFTVNTTADTHDVNPGDGTCADSQGKCSLRAATEEADALPAGSSITITVPAGTYKLRLGALFLTAQRSIMINGASSKTTIIKGNYSFRVLYIASLKMFASLSQLTIEGGSTHNGGFGGGIDNGGTLSVSNCTIRYNTAGGSGAGIFNHGTLSVSASIFSYNTASGRGYGGGGIFNVGMLSVSSSTFSGNSTAGYGGGINNHGTLTISTSTFSGNIASRNGGGIDNRSTLSMSASTLSRNIAYQNGGGIENLGKLSMDTSTLIDNSADYNGGQNGYGDGGGIFNNGGRLSVSNSTLHSNWATTSGGGIFNTGGTATVSSSTFNGNAAMIFSGGGIYNQAGRLSVSSSTFNGNSAAGYGGGIYNQAGRLSVSSSTFSGNSAYAGGGIDNGGSPTVTLTGTIMANSPTGGNCAGPISEVAGYNLDSGSSCGFTLSTDLNNTDPLLGPLGNNGGPTQTMALLQGSKAIDWVAASSCPTTDQRGYTRPDGSGESTCDIGAYESAY